MVPAILACADSDRDASCQDMIMKELGNCWRVLADSGARSIAHARGARSTPLTRSMTSHPRASPDQGTGLGSAGGVRCNCQR